MLDFPDGHCFPKSGSKLGELSSEAEHESLLKTFSNASNFLTDKKLVQTFSYNTGLVQIFETLNVDKTPCGNC